MSVENIILLLISSHITGKSIENLAPADFEFEKICEKAYEQKIFPICADAMLNNCSDLLTRENFSYLKTSIYSNIHYYYKRFDFFTKVYGKLIDAGATPVIVKGYVCGKNYPLCEYRISGDEDLLVSEEDFEICYKILLDLGFTPDRNTKENEVGFVSDNKLLRIELHKSLFPLNKSAFSVFNGYFDVFDRKKITVNSFDFYTLKEDSNLLYLIIHAFKHFIMAGVGIRQICDICLYCKNNSINWDYIFNSCKDLNAFTFLNAVLLVCEKYFGLDIEPIMSQTEDFDRNLDINDFIDDLLKNSVYGDNSSEGNHAAVLNERAFIKKGKNAHNYYLSALFPSLKIMKAKYSVLYKYPVLLPVMWLVRIFSYIKSDNNSKESVKISKQRVALLKEYKVI